MARHKLTEKACKALSEPGIYSDGDGLYLRVRPGGSKQWLFVYRWEGKRAELGLGGYGAGTAPVPVSLAREKAAAIRDMLARKEDPKADKKTGATFAEIMEDVIKVKAKSSKNEKHRQQWAMTLREYAKPLHDLPVAKVTIDDVVRTLNPIWETKPETADRTRMRIAAVMDTAKARGLFKGDNPAAWRGALENLLPARNKLSRGHHPALDYKAMPATMRALRESSAVSARAVEFLCLTACRSGEVRGAVWSEIDLDGALWVIPAVRMKAGAEHRVPLTDRAVAILKTQKQAATSDLVFEGGKVVTPISDTAMNKSLRAASGDKTVTIHGIRSTFRDWAGDETHHPRDVIEMALAHTVRDKTEAAYRRQDALQKRRALMDDWERYCTK
ncbi:integrase arm-type DNA-binding domain-containing protein [Rhizobium cremeum]|uniref:tyrosine-type recombinase/integrase n=1 Tax=Rhizobium cremeum TaxID=2813827 RepID=UPI001FD0AAF2|nr:site-specific integrase [Rhizobium cremeum]MCJ7995884.1 integrase arm-type DNA-binding domain-containing protein [Rhizobium cremeum]MCJ7999639.1 integrase arm-type DNA-binding domain-containing protein [Rhizobium cremeum]